MSTPVGHPINVGSRVCWRVVVLAGIGATVHCHNSLVADRLESEAASVALTVADVGIRVAFSCPIRDRNSCVYGDQHSLLPRLPPADRAAIESSFSAAAPAHRLVEQVEAITQAHEGKLFQAQYGPIVPQWCQDATLELIAGGRMWRYPPKPGTPSTVRGGACSSVLLRPSAPALFAPSRRAVRASSCTTALRAEC